MVTNRKIISYRAGDPTPFLQKDSEIVIDEYGVMRGTAVFEIDTDLVPVMTPRVNIDVHPKDSRLTCYEVSVKFSKMSKAVISASYLGLQNDPSIPKIEFAGGSGQEKIETHPDFYEFAGDVEEPKNGAKFDEETGAFKGFTNKKDYPEFAGVESYIVPSVLVNYSYYTSSVPSLSPVGRIFGGLPGFRRPPNVRNFLLIGMPYRQIANVFFVTEQYLGSSEQGWSRTIY